MVTLLNANTRRYSSCPLDPVPVFDPLPSPPSSLPRHRLSVVRFIYSFSHAGSTLHRLGHIYCPHLSDERNETHVDKGGRGVSEWSRQA